MDKMKTFLKCLKYFILFLALLFTISLLFNSEAHHLGKGFIYSEVPSYINYQRRGDTLRFDIAPDVIAYWNNPKNILIKQHPQKYGSIMFQEPQYPYGRDTVYYWFIDKRTKEVFGPALYTEMEVYLHDKQLKKNLKQLAEESQ